MNLMTGTLLLAAGAVGGIVNALAGGATLITFPAMLAAGLPAIAANASNAVAISPGHLIAALADRRRLPAFDKRLCLLTLFALVGGALGGLVLLHISERDFTLPVPALIAFATALFALAPTIQRRAEQRHEALGRSRTQYRALGSIGLASVYGGFFGAGLGVMLTAVLAITEPGDLRSVKALKNLLATAVSAAAVLVFIVKGIVVWPPTLVMLVGAAVGGYAGGHLIRILPATTVRRIVIVAGVAMTIIYADRYWF